MKMKPLIASVTSILAAIIISTMVVICLFRYAEADTTYTILDNIILSTDGTTYTQYDNLIIGSDGSSTQRFGNIILHTDGIGSTQPLRPSHEAASREDLPSHSTMPLMLLGNPH